MAVAVAVVRRRVAQKVSPNVQRKRPNEGPGKVARVVRYWGCTAIRQSESSRGLVYLVKENGKKRGG